MAKRYHFQHHYSTNNNAKPNINDLMLGEIAINACAGNEKLFIKNSNGELIELDLNVVTTTPETSPFIINLKTNITEEDANSLKDTVYHNNVLETFNEILEEGTLQIAAKAHYDAPTGFTYSNVIYSVTIDGDKVYVPCYVKPFLYSGCVIQIFDKNKNMVKQQEIFGSIFDNTTIQFTDNDLGQKNIKLLVDWIIINTKEDGSLLNKYTIHNVRTGQKSETNNYGITTEPLYVKANDELNFYEHHHDGLVKLPCTYYVQERDIYNTTNYFEIELATESTTTSEMSTTTPELMNTTTTTTTTPELMNTTTTTTTPELMNTTTTTTTTPEMSTTTPEWMNVTTTTSTSTPEMSTTTPEWMNTTTTTSTSTPEMSTTTTEEALVRYIKFIVNGEEVDYNIDCMLHYNGGGLSHFYFMYEGMDKPVHIPFIYSDLYVYNGSTDTYTLVAKNVYWKGQETHTFTISFEAQTTPEPQINMINEEGSETNNLDQVLDEYLSES